MIASVIIPAYNEEKYLSQCLEALVHQRTNHVFEVIVVDNNSSDATAEIARSFVQKYSTNISIKVITEKQKGRGAARATGFRHALGEFLFSTDADSQVPPTWIDYMIAVFQDPHVVAVTGSLHVTDLTKIKTFFIEFSLPLTMRCFAFLSGYFWLNGFNFAIRRSVYLATSGFDPNLNCLEDFDLSLKLARWCRQHREENRDHRGERHESYGRYFIAFKPQLRVQFSGRRFHKMFFHGIWQYVWMTVTFFFNPSSSYLSDVR